MKLINRFLAWINEPAPHLGCPDPELHGRNNENYDVLVTALKSESVGG